LEKKEGLITVDQELYNLLEQDHYLKENVLFKSGIPDAEMPIFYNLASVFAFPSLYEGFGFPPVEAMACGCPIILSNIEVLKEINEEAALYVNPLNPDDISEKIHNLLSNNNLRMQLQQKGFKRAKRFNWESAAKKHIEVIEQI